MSEVVVEVNNRVRLVSAVLAAGQWPEHEQVGQPHAVHAIARHTREYVVDYAGHPAVALADAWVADGRPLTDLYTAALRCQWPFFDAVEPLPASLAGSAWPQHLADFYTDTAIAAFLWSDHEATWQEAAGQLKRVLPTNRLATFLGRLRRRPLARTIRIIPNLTYPALTTLVADTSQTIDVILPPPKAVGESPPWAYGQGAGWVLAEVCRALVPELLSETLAGLETEPSQYLRHGATILFLQEAMDEAAALAYLVQKRKQDDLPRLAAVTDGLREWLAQPNGRPLADVVA